MDLFNKTQATEPEPQTETVEAARSLREAELLAEIKSLDGQLATLRGLAETFRKEHFAIVGGKVVFAAPDPNARDTLAAQWSAICASAGDVVVKRNSLLAEWSELCASHSQETVHVAGKVVRRGT